MEPISIAGATAQANCSASRRGVIRVSTSPASLPGQAKYVTCVSGWVGWPCWPSTTSTVGRWS